MPNLKKLASVHQLKDITKVKQLRESNLRQTLNYEQITEKGKTVRVVKSCSSILYDE